MKRKLSLVLVMVLVLSSFLSVSVTAFGQDDNTVDITILGTSDIHGAINSYTYEDGSDYGDVGLLRISSLVKSVKEGNPNTLVVDNGDTIQGSILTDDLYNTQLDKMHPMIDMMNHIGYDAMVLGNHEFNFGLDLIEKIEEDAEFPLLSANTYYKSNGNHFVEDYIIKDVDGVKVGILGLTVPSIPRWDGPKVEELMFKHMGEEAEKYANMMRDEGADLVFVAAHAGLESRHEPDGSDAAEYILDADIDGLLVGHDHISLAEERDGILVGAPEAPYGNASEVVKFDFTLTNNNGSWAIDSQAVETLKIADYEEDQELKDLEQKYHQNVLDFLNETLTIATDDFHPESEVPGIPTAQIQDTAVMDLINNVQLEYTDADVSAAALFKPSSNIPEGEVTYADVFNIYKYPNTLYTVEVTGKELKDYMEWSAAYYNTYQPGDLTISFNPDIRGYNYDMFAGVDYKIDISKAPGNRIVDLTMDGEPIEDDQMITLAINNYRYGGLTSMGIISNEPSFESDPKSLRSYIKDYLESFDTISPEVDNNWEITGVSLDHPLRDEVIQMVKEGTLEIPTSPDGRTPNVEALNIYELIAKNKIETDDVAINIVHTNDTHSRIEADDYAGSIGFAKIKSKMNELESMNDNLLALDAGDAFHGQTVSQLNEGEAIAQLFNLVGYDALAPGNHDFNYGFDRLLELNEMTDFPIIAANVKKLDEYIVKPGDTLSEIAYDHGLTLQAILENNTIKNPDLIYPGDKIKLAGEMQNAFDPYMIKEIDGVKVGVFGLATPETAYKTHPNNVKGIEFTSPVDSAQATVNQLKEENVDVIIGLTHLGMAENTKEEWRSTYIAENVEGIDLIVDGHSHTVLPNGKRVNNTLIVSTEDYDKNLGFVSLVVDNGEVIGKFADLITKEEMATVEPDEAVLNLIDQIEKENEKITSVVVAETDQELNGERAFVRSGQTNLGNLITKAMKELTNADVALTNGGGIRASIDQGPVTKGEVITVLPFGNYVVKLEVTGQTIIDAMEHGLSAYPEVEGFFPHIAGMTVKFDSTKPKGERVQEIMINSNPIDPNASYTLATNDFLAAGGDEYTMLSDGSLVTEYGGLDEILIRWMQDNGTEGALVDDRLQDVSGNNEAISDQAM